MGRLAVVRQPPVMNEHLVPGNLKGYVSACCASLEDCHNLVKWWGLGKNYMPTLPVLLVYPEFRTVAFIAGEGYCTAAELEDNAITAYGRALEKFKKNDGMLVNSDEMREKFGLVERSQVSTAISEALDDRIKRHQASPVTDPPREPLGLERKFISGPTE